MGYCGRFSRDREGGVEREGWQLNLSSKTHTYLALHLDFYTSRDISFSLILIVDSHAVYKLLPRNGLGNVSYRGDEILDLCWRYLPCLR